jgi:hypothetical protein
MGCVGAGLAREKGGKGPSMTQREGGRGVSGRRATAATGQHRPGHVGHGRAGVAAQNSRGGELPCGPHGTVPVGRVKRRSIGLKINLN